MNYSSTFTSVCCPKCKRFGLVLDYKDSTSISCDHCQNKYNPSRNWPFSINTWTLVDVQVSENPYKNTHDKSKISAALFTTLGFITISFGYQEIGVLGIIIGIVSLISMEAGPYQRWELEHHSHRRNPSEAAILKAYEYLDLKLKKSEPRYHNEYSPPEKIMAVLKRNKFDKSALYALAADMCKHFGLGQSVNIRVIDDKANDTAVQTKNLAGNYSHITGTISISRRVDYTINQLLAILAHECVHHKLYISGIQWPSPPDNEIFTLIRQL